MKRSFERTIQRSNNSPAQVSELINLPNALTSLRIICIGIFLWLFFSNLYWPSLVVFALAGLTDLLDGYFARKNNQITWLGKILDPIADKLMVCAALASLAYRGWTPLWLVGIVAIKEASMLVGGLILMRRGIIIPSISIGKVATSAFLLAIAVTFFHPLTEPWDLLLQIIACALAVIALVRYGIIAWKAICDA